MIDCVNDGLGKLGQKRSVTYGGQVEVNKSAIYGNKCTLIGNGQ